MMFAPLEGWRHVKVTDRHTAADYAHVLKDLADIHFAHAKTIVLIQDNLSIHSKASLYEALPAVEARRLVERFEWHYTPKHGSWLDLAESELGVLTSQCLNRRIPDKQTLIDEIAAWEHDRNANHTKGTGNSPPKCSHQTQASIPFNLTEFRQLGGSMKTKAPQRNQRFDVFISHASKDARFARQLVPTLELDELKTWIDDADVRFGRHPRVPGVSLGVVQGSLRIALGYGGNVHRVTLPTLHHPVRAGSRARAPVPVKHSLARPPA